MKRLSNLSESKLFTQLEQAQTNDATARSLLAGHVRWVVDHAQIISQWIIRRLPQYTLHDGTHLFNVLSIMEELLPEETLRQLTPLECALCILAAFTHDLGMVMLDDKVQKYQETTGTPENQEWLRHCAAYPEELRQIKHWKQIADNEPARKAEASRCVSYLEGHLLAEFIRKRHADSLDPILHWLNQLEKEAQNLALFRYGNLNFKRYLAQIGVSHGQCVTWLRETLVQGNRPDRFCRLANSERVNFAFPGLLVRLADIMDFDASRAPSILYQYFGIGDAVSILEWNKHMAITGWGFDNNTLRYEADECGHPVYEKSIRGFVSAIEREVKSVSEELHWQRTLLGDGSRHYQLRLSEFVHSQVHAALDDQGQPVYIFHDLQFQLDQYEIQQLLMGESLYADPTLCLRELLQNALDALQMRDLRLKVLAQNPDARVEPTDSLRPREALQIHVTWGRDAAREYIRVEDNGCGMTREVLERYFTKLGKSYYRSPEYERERQILREYGFIVSPISQFGIGFLSCFMLADEIRLRTRPGQANNRDRAAYDVRLSGPGSLFWLTPGTRERQGTEITLYLKPPFTLDADPERAIRWLKAYFYSSELRGEDQEDQKEWETLEQQKRIDPLWITGRYVIWPLFPILLKPESNDCSAVRLDDRFHGNVLAPINIRAVEKKAQDWDIPISTLGQPRWESLDWEDHQGAHATGTRIRLIFPYHQLTGDEILPLDPPPDSPLVRTHELAALVETTLETSDQKNFLTVKGIAVNNLKVCAEMLPVAAGVGTKLWIDLRGYAAPRLTADRKTALPREDIEGWPSVFQGVFQRWCNQLQGFLNQHPSQLNSSLLSALATRSELRLRASPTPHLQRWALQAAHHPAAEVGLWLVTLLFQEVSCTLALALARDLALARALDLARIFASRHVCWELSLLLHFLPEAFADDLSHSFPALGVCGLKGQAGDGWLVAPGWIEWDVDPITAEVQKNSLKEQWPQRLIEQCYDLVFPLTHIPLGQLRRDCPEWRTDRSFRALGVLAYFFLGADEWLKKHSQDFLDRFNVPHIHALLPKPELWLKPFDHWLETDWSTCGLSALWDIKSGIVYWAEGAHSADEMKRVGQPTAQSIH